MSFSFIPLGGACITYSVNGNTFHLGVGTPTGPYTYQTTLQVTGPGGNSIPQGGSWTFPISASVGGVDSISGDPQFSVSILYLGSPDPRFHFSGSNGQGTIQVDPSTPPGIYLREFAVNAQVNSSESFASITQYLVMQITVTGAAQPDFTISNVTTESLSAGTAANFSMVIAPVNGFTGPVTLTSPGVTGPLTVSGGQAGAIGVTFSPASVTLNGAPQTVTSTVAANGNATGCAYRVPFTASSGQKVHTGAMNVNVQGPAPDFALSIYPITVAAGSYSQAALTIDPTACSSGTVTFSSVPRRTSPSYSLITR